jgi:hypothetical protein
MKRIYTLLLFLGATFSVNLVSGQGSPGGPDTQSDIFRKSMWNYSLNQRFNFSSYGIKYDDQKVGNQNEFDTRLRAEYFVADNWFIGGEIGYNSEVLKEDDTGDKFTECSNLIGLTGGYAKRLFDDKVPLRSRLKFGVGRVMDKYSDDTGEQKNSGFRWRTGVDIGFPLNIYNNVIFVEPTVSYNYSSEKQDDYTINRSGFKIGANINFSLGCDEHICDFERKGDVPEDRYDAGTIQIGGGPKAKIAFGSITEKYTSGNEENKYKEGFSNFKIQGGAYVYPIKYLGAGASINLNTRTTNSKDTDYSTSSTGFTFMPMVVGHVPVEGILSQAFVDLGIGFGTQSSKTTNTNGEENKDKSSVTEYYAGVGFDFFVHNQMSLTLSVGYSAYNVKDKDTDVKTNWSGVVTGIAWNGFLKGWE